ncbi:OmpA family protein [Neisseria sp. oral taxon 014]|uniref:OmpA family protein n=1 Tax=Neisseria sp. oral taxon 014 TaxID=641148 RepID=UPI0025D476EE|nr:OmpA family protein [Neisseria sp. oral taxon 014]
MKTLRSLTCVAVISALCACGQKPDEPAAQQQQASLVQASTAETPQPQPEPVAPSAPVPMPAPAPASAPATAQNSAAAQGSSLTAQSSSLSGTETGFNIQINLSSDVLFDFDKAELKPEADGELQKAADIIRQKGKGLILITGYTDSKGTDAYNKRLSLARAQAVKNWFEAQGLHQNYQTEGLGAANPVAPNTNDDGSDNPEGRAKNRRVEIIVNKTKQLGE